MGRKRWLRRVLVVLVVGACGVGGGVSAWRWWHTPPALATTSAPVLATRDPFAVAGRQAPRGSTANLLLPRSAGVFERQAFRGEGPTGHSQYCSQMICVYVSLYVQPTPQAATAIVAACADTETTTTTTADGEIVIGHRQICYTRGRYAFVFQAADDYAAEYLPRLVISFPY